MHSLLPFYMLLLLLSHFSHVQLCVTLWTVAHQAPLSMGFSRQEYWNGLPCCPSGDFPNPETEPTSPASPALQADSLPTELHGKPRIRVSVNTHIICMCVCIYIYTHTHTYIHSFQFCQFQHCLNSYGLELNWNKKYKRLQESYILKQLKWVKKFIEKICV